MDWLWVYATIARNVGWTYRKIGKQPASDIFALLDDIAERPPSYIIDGIVHLKPKPKKLSTQDLAAVQTNREANAVATSMLGPAQRMPENVRALLAWADNLGVAKKT
jgi:hypothetical protein